MISVTEQRDLDELTSEYFHSKLQAEQWVREVNRMIQEKKEGCAEGTKVPVYALGSLEPIEFKKVPEPLPILSGEYHSWSGADIRISFAGKTVGTAQGLCYQSEIGRTFGQLICLLLEDQELIPGMEGCLIAVAVNEYGKAAACDFGRVKLVKVTSGFSVDDIVIEYKVTWESLDTIIPRWQKIGESSLRDDFESVHSTDTEWDSSNFNSEE